MLASNRRACLAPLLIAPCSQQQRRRATAITSASCRCPSAITNTRTSPAPSSRRSSLLDHRRVIVSVSCPFSSLPSSAFAAASADSRGATSQLLHRMQQRRHRSGASGSRRKLVTMMANKASGGPFAPLVRVVRDALGDKEVNKLRGKAISLHSQVIKEFGKTFGVDNKQVQGVIRLAKKNGEKLGFLA